MDDTLQRLLPPGVVCMSGPLPSWKGELYQDEAELLKGASPKRLYEFTAGRLCAREALRRLGIPAQPILIGPKREPLWPTGVVGSLTHCDGLCAAAVCRTDKYIGLGIDIETAGPLDKDMVELVCGPGEGWLQAMPEETRHIWARVVFSAKESVYKCLFPLTRVFLEFLDISIRLNAGAGRFHARLSGPPPQPVSGIPSFEGCFAITRGRIFTAVAIPK